ncbi:MAG: zf-HC2 domain-containing protein [Pseudodesulfovibrio sp.]|uniref:zf-HC2 domain-containing protein n=1 Tax=Pseudodesulfovibrio sp. TaxID=2035812 RepID=UPI003D1072A7
MRHDFSDEHLAELGLAATETGRDPGPCPSAGDLAALQEGRLDAPRRAEVLAHLDGCADCMARWLAVSSEGAQPVADPAPRPVSPVFLRAVAVAAAVAACLFLAVRFLPHIVGGPDFAQSVDAGYRLVLDDPRLYAELDGPVREMAASIGVRGAETPAARAFEAGWRAGLDALGRGGDSLASPSGGERAAYVFSAGRWSALVHAVLLADPPPGGGFWTEQARTAGLFRDRTSLFAPEDGARLRALWADMAKVLERLGETPGQPRDRDRLRRLLEGLDRAMGELDLGAG